MLVFRVMFSLVTLLFIVYIRWHTVKYIAFSIKKSLKSSSDALPFSLQGGQGLVEYALVLVLVAIVVIAILSLLGPEIEQVFGRVACELIATGREWVMCEHTGGVGGEWIIYCGDPDNPVVCDWSPGTP